MLCNSQSICLASNQYASSRLAHVTFETELCHNKSSPNTLHCSAKAHLTWAVSNCREAVHFSPLAARKQFTRLWAEAATRSTGRLYRVILSQNGYGPPPLRNGMTV
uniref:Uncharacterized protein n=2 Tax=Prorocentrum micans TaxID=2945 RepID=A0A7S2TCF4_PROMC|mmetsp:Transcript_18361/g.14857  ORF Transcript_18361/g.14857 Transcript_18361/m.14857 type:complete len:106 (+) Transcript_18361:101-418(+)